MAKIGEKPKYDKQGNVEPVNFDLSKLVAYLPNADYPDDAELQSPINKIEEISVFNRDFYKINITIYKDLDLNIDLFVKASNFKEKPLIDDPIRGFIWTQGYLKKDDIIPNS